MCIICADIPLVSLNALSNVDVDVVAPLIDNPGPAVSVERQVVCRGIASHIAAVQRQRL